VIGAQRDHQGEKMHIVVAGGNGFIGSHFVARACELGHRITIFGHTPTPRVPHDGAFEFVEGGLDALANDAEMLRSADLICHFASSSIPATATADPVGDIERNLVGTVALLEAMRHNGNKRILFLSSGGAVYGTPQITPIPESHPLNPISAYGITKLAIERYLMMYQTLYGFQSLIIRPSNPYGPGQGTYGQLGAVTTFLNLALRGETAKLFGDGSVVRDFVYIDDLIDFILAAIASAQTGVMNCGAGVGTSLNALIALIEDVTGRELAREYLPKRGFDPQEITLDISRGNDCLKWQPKTTLRRGIEQIIQAQQNA
jgi:UDP-glucose 4-epimerase